MTDRSSLKSHVRWMALALACALLALVPASRTADADAPAFLDVTAARGIDVVIQPDVREDWGSGAAWGDFDGDGDMDLYVAMGHGEENRLYRSDGAASFVDEAASLGCADAGKGKGVKFCDYDNDGDQDIFISNIDGSNRLYQNDGSRFFYDVTVQSGLAYNGKSYGASWADFDNDGWLDLYVCTRAQVPNLLYHNLGPDPDDNGAVKFANVTAAAGVEVPDRLSFEVVWIDYDLDGDLDIFIAVDKRIGNKLLRNNGPNGQGQVTFTDVTAETNTGQQIDGMGIAVGDYDNDGFEDLYVTHTNPGHILLHNNKGVNFTDVADGTGVRAFRLGWGTEFLDYNNDGFLDLYVVHWTATPGQSGARNFLYRNNAGVNFTEVGAQEGVGDTGSGHGLAVGDYNDDGFIDLFVVNSDGPSKLFENQPTGGRWLKVRTVGKERVGLDDEVLASNRDGIGARVHVQIGTFHQYRTVRAGSSYLSMASREVEFGLGPNITVDLVEIQWPSGIVDSFENVDANQTLTVREGETLEPPPLPPPTPPVPPAFALYQNHPNPFNPQTIISFSLDRAGQVKLAIFDGRGRLVDILVNEEVAAGPHDVIWEPGLLGDRVASGMYFYRLETPTGMLSRKMMLVK